jgi:hypothetical protein
LLAACASLEGGIAPDGSWLWGLIALRLGVV